MHKICKVRDLDPGHYQKKKMFQRTYQVLTPDPIRDLILDLVVNGVQSILGFISLIMEN